MFAICLCSDWLVFISHFIYCKSHASDYIIQSWIMEMCRSFLSTEIIYLVAGEYSSKWHLLLKSPIWTWKYKVFNGSLWIADHDCESPVCGKPGFPIAGTGSCAGSTRQVVELQPVLVESCQLKPPLLLPVRSGWSARTDGLSGELIWRQATCLKLRSIRPLKGKNISDKDWGSCCTARPVFLSSRRRSDPS